MTITRRGLAVELDRLDKEIAERNDAKRDCLVAYREQLETGGRTRGQIRDELQAFRTARREFAAWTKDPDTAAAIDALAGEILHELQRPEKDGTGNALRVHARESNTTPAAAAAAPTKAHEQHPDIHDPAWDAIGPIPKCLDRTAGA